MAGEKTTDEVFDALAAAQRRRLLFALLDDAPQHVTELSGVPWSIPKSEADTIAEHHRHLPKLDESGFIDWDREEQVITKGPRFDEIEPVLECLNDRRDELPIELL
ncbi:DUF7344 domain-containing protein [Halopiger aswanensis]|uniref:DUF7344 domain-containing protein n=1 Tax=Halopiger aswanensis TaxID=148449 RepID=A0A419WDA8_9EURY|nr:transcriptional regulator [Halopiger aswanensis]RKD93468.1 hypothetical protein ATJ93_3092 [Halopiger aswanensis]